MVWQAKAEANFTYLLSQKIIHKACHFKGWGCVVVCIMIKYNFQL